MRRALLLTAVCALAGVIGGCGSSGSGSDKKAPPAESYLSKAAPGYRYVALNSVDEQRFRSQFGKGLDATDQLVVRRVLKGDHVAAAALVLQLKKGQNLADLVSGVEAKATGAPTDVKIGGKDAKLIKSNNLYEVYDTDGRTFLGVFAQTAAEAEKVAAPIVR